MDCRRQTLPTRLAGADPSAAPKVAQLATPAVEAILRDGSLDKLARSAALQKVGPLPAHSPACR